MPKHRWEPQASCKSAFSVRYFKSKPEACQVRLFTLLILSLASLSLRANAQTLSDYGKLHEYLEKRVDEARELEFNARQSVDRAAALVAAAAADPDALSRAKAALAIRQRTYARAQKLREVAEHQLGLFESALRAATTAERIIGVPVLQRRGEITVKTATGTRKFDGRIEAGDVVHTDSTGKISLLLPWGTVLTIGPHSALEISKEKPNVYVRGNYSSFYVLEQCAGAVLRDGYCSVIYLPACNNSCGGAIRGSEVAVEGVDSATSRVEVFDGAVDFRDSSGAVTFTVKKGMSALVRVSGGKLRVTPDSVRIPDWWSQF